MLVNFRDLIIKFYLIYEPDFQVKRIELKIK